MKEKENEPELEVKEATVSTDVTEEQIEEAKKNLKPLRVLVIARYSHSSSFGAIHAFEDALESEAVIDHKYNDSCFIITVPDFHKFLENIFKICDEHRDIQEVSITFAPAAVNLIFYRKMNGKGTVYISDKVQQMKEMEEKKKEEVNDENK